MLRDGFIVVDDTRVAGFAVVDMGREIPLLMVGPACQRRGTGSMSASATSWHTKAMMALRRVAGGGMRPGRSADW